MRTVEELVGTLDGANDDWHRLPRWKRIPPLESGALRMLAA